MSCDHSLQNRKAKQALVNHFAPTFSILMLNLTDILRQLYGQYGTSLNLPKNMISRVKIEVDFNGWMTSHCQFYTFNAEKQTGELYNSTWKVLTSTITLAFFFVLALGSSDPFLLFSVYMLSSSSSPVSSA